MNPICTHIQERLIEQQLTGQTGPDDAAIQAHLQTCSHCREFQKQLDRDHDRLTQYAQSVEPLVTGLQDRVAQRLGSSRQRRYGLRRLTSPLSMSLAAGMLIVVAVWAVLYRPDMPSISTSEPQPIASEQAPLPIDHTVTSHLYQEQTQAKSLFTACDIGGLMNLLDTGLAPTQVMVAGYLAELNASQATSVLQRLASTWTGDPGTNPFAQAMERLNASRQEPNVSPKEKETAKTLASPTDRTLRFQVIDKATGQPLPGASVKKEKVEYTTDANGCCRIDITDPDCWGVHITASKPGYIGQCISLAVKNPNKPAFSKTHIFALDQGTLIGGIVQDVNGVPIEGATVNVSIHTNNHTRENEDIMEPLLCVEFQHQTDAAGRWFCDTAPKNLLSLAEDSKFGYSIDHEDYASEGTGVCDTSGVKAMFDQSFRVTLYKGYTFRGRLINTKGEAIAGAKIFGSGPTQITGPDGTFLFLNIHPNTTRIHMQLEADRYPRSGTAIDYSPEMGVVDIVLDPGWTLLGRVMDTQSRPIPEAHIEIITPYNTRPQGETDVEGRFTISPICLDAEMVHVSKSGFQTFIRTIEGPTDQSMDIILHRSIVASGSVLDALTGRPIEQFRIISGLVSPEGKIIYDTDRNNIAPGKAGHYECHFEHIYSSNPNTRYTVIIEADGYLSTESRAIDPDEGAVIIDLALIPGTGPAGTVLDANGLAAANTFVYALVEKDPIGYYGFIPLLFCRKPMVKTGEDGRFSFEAFYQLRHILATGDQGICSATVEDLQLTKSLMLRPWAEVHGIIHTASGTPAKKLLVEIGSMPEAMDRLGYKLGLSTNTDDQGTFQIKRVPPGEFTLLGKTYQVAPGQVLTLDLTVDPNAAAPSK